MDYGGQYSSYKLDFSHDLFRDVHTADVWTTAKNNVYAREPTKRPLQEIMDTL